MRPNPNMTQTRNANQSEPKTRKDGRRKTITRGGLLQRIPIKANPNLKKTEERETKTQGGLSQGTPIEANPNTENRKKRDQNP